jgi:hypothetical protein
MNWRRTYIPPLRRGQQPSKYQLGTTAAANASKDLLVYPFIAGNSMLGAAKGLLLGEDPLNCSSSPLPQFQQEKSSWKNHFVTMQQEDIDWLQPGLWLNDCIIDF